MLLRIDQKERDKRNIQLAYKLYFIGWDQLQKSPTPVKAPYEFVDASHLFFMFIFNETNKKNCTIAVAPAQTSSLGKWKLQSYVHMYMLLTLAV